MAPFKLSLYPVLMQILFSRSQSAPDVPLRFIDIQNLPGLSCKTWVDMEKAVCYIFMFGCR